MGEVERRVFSVDGTSAGCSSMAKRPYLRVLDVPLSALTHSPWRNPVRAEPLHSVDAVSMVAGRG